MKLAFTLGITGAVVLHAGVLLFGGALFLDDEKDHASLQQVELLSEDETAAEDEEQRPEELTDSQEDLEAEVEEAPDAAEIIRSLELASSTDAPALEAVSLSAIEQALSGQAGGGDFGDALSFSSGGRIGGTGKAGALDDALEGAFSLAEIDQKPRLVFQAAPLYPAEMRGKKLEGLVTVIFIVDASGKVANPRVVQSTLPAFEKPALDAVKQWKFEPAVKGGQRVGCKMRAPIRFQAS